MTDKLLNCPFCGGEAEIIHESVGRWYVRCKKCWCRTKVNTSEMFAIVDWNTRKPMDRIVEQLEEEKNHCCVGCYEDYDPYEDGRFETYEEVIALLKGVQNE